MTPYEIDILLHYYSRADDHPDIQRNPPVWRPTIEVFIEREILTRQIDHSVCYVLTPRGKAYVDALQRVPLPVQAWIMPEVER